MYLLTVHGFVSVVVQDNERKYPPFDPYVAEAVPLYSGDKVLAIRSRDSSTIGALSLMLTRKPTPLLSPAGWDYPWRMYVTQSEWCQILTNITHAIDYPNFKNKLESQDKKPSKLRELESLAYDIWTAVYNHGRLK